MRRIPWDILLALLIGLGLGLVYSWILSPKRVTDAAPALLRTDFKEIYRSAVASSFAATGNLPRAQARLALLEDPDPVEALNAQAQRMLTDSQSFQQADEVAALAVALQNGRASIPTVQQGGPTQIAQEGLPSATETLPPAPPDIPLQLTETPPTFGPEAPIATATPRPTQTAQPTLGAPFLLTGQDSLCDTNLPDGLLQVLILNSNRRQMPGMKITITWDGGSEQFFTGLKPELGNGYADFLMTPNVTYTVQLASGSDIAAGLTAPTCQSSSGDTFYGGIKLTFQQP